MDTRAVFLAACLLLGFLSNLEAAPLLLLGGPARSESALGPDSALTPKSPFTPRSFDSSAFRPESPSAPRRFDSSALRPESPSAPRSFDSSQLKPESPSGPRIVDSSALSPGSPSAPRRFDPSTLSGSPSAPRSFDPSMLSGSPVRPEDNDDYNEIEGSNGVPVKGRPRLPYMPGGPTSPKGSGGIRTTPVVQEPTSQKGPSEIKSNPGQREPNPQDTIWTDPRDQVPYGTGMELEHGGGFTITSFYTITQKIITSMRNFVQVHFY